MTTKIDYSADRNFILFAGNQLGTVSQLIDQMIKNGINTKTVLFGAAKGLIEQQIERLSAFDSYTAITYDVMAEAVWPLEAALKRLTDAASNKHLSQNAACLELRINYAELYGSNLLIAGAYVRQAIVQINIQHLALCNK